MVNYYFLQVITQCDIIISLRQEALVIDERSAWVLDITDVYYNIALVGKEHICVNFKNDIMVSLVMGVGLVLQNLYTQFKILFVYGFVNFCSVGECTQSNQ